MTSASLACIQSELKGCTYAEQLAFGICVLERSVPDYFAFQEETGQAGGGALREALAYAWSALKGSENVDRRSIEKTLYRCEQWIPDSEDHASALTSSAINTMASACSMLEHVLSRSPRAILDMTSVRYDTVDLFVQNNSFPGVPKAQQVMEPAHHPLLQRELQMMVDDLQCIKMIPDAGSLATNLLRHLLGRQHKTLKSLTR